MFGYYPAHLVFLFSVHSPLFSCQSMIIMMRNETVLRKMFPAEPRVLLSLQNTLRLLCRQKSNFRPGYVCQAWELAVDPRISVGKKMSAQKK